MQAAAAVSTVAKVATPISVGIEASGGVATIASAAQNSVEAGKIAAETAGALGKTEVVAPEAIKAAVSLENVAETIDTLPKEVASSQFEQQMGDFVAKTLIEEGAGGDVKVELGDIKTGGKTPLKDAPPVTDVTNKTSSTQENSSIAQSGSPAQENDKKETQINPQSDEVTRFTDFAEAGIEKAQETNTAITQKVESQMQEWDKRAIPTDKKGFEQYMKDRDTAIKDYTVTARVENDMQSWLMDSKNVEPDKQDVKAHAEWQKRYDTEKQRLTKDHNKRFDKELKNEQKEDSGMSEEEFARKVTKLKDRIVAQTDFDQAMKYCLDALRTAPTEKRAEIQANLDRLRSQQNQNRANITALQAELRLDAATSRGLRGTVKKLALPMLLIGITMAGPAMQAANEE